MVDIAHHPVFVQKHISEAHSATVNRKVTHITLVSQTYRANTYRREVCCYI